VIHKVWRWIWVYVVYAMKICPSWKKYNWICTVRTEGTSSQNWALRRWNFHALFSPIGKFGGYKFRRGSLLAFDLRKVMCLRHLERTWLLGITTELRESEHLVSISILARKRDPINERGAKPQEHREKERMIMQWKDEVTDDDRSNSLADDIVGGCFVKGYKRD